jgi:protocatechuate 3,4-dioxygenase beta subunit
MKYNDLNRNGKLDANEPGLQGWVIRLLLDDPVTNKDTLVTTTTTDANGNYSFTNLGPGIYDVRETHQTGWKRTSKNPKDIIITDVSVITNVDFGNAKIKRGEKEDTNNDDNRDDQSGHFFGNHGWSNYMLDFNKSAHIKFNGHFGFGDNSGFKGNLLNFFKK